MISDMRLNTRCRLDRLDRVVVHSLVAVVICGWLGATEVPIENPVPTVAVQSIGDRIARIVQGLTPPLQLDGEPVASRDLEEAMAGSGVPALVLAVVDDCEVEWSEGWGRIGDSEATVSGRTPFQVGSVSKMVTAVVAMRMVAAGKVGLDQQVNELLTSWKLSGSESSGEHAVLVRHLLGHSAGLTRTAYWFGRDEPMPPLAAILRGEARNPAIVVEGVPGARATPSNSGFLVLQSVLEDVSGLSLADLADEQLFAPLAMTSSAFEPVDSTFLERCATNHGRDGNALEGKAPLIPGAPGGLWSSAEDLARLVAELMKSWQGRSESLLPREVTRQMLSPQLGDMALGMHTRGEGETFSVQQAGGGVGSLSHVVAYPDRCQGAAIVVNTDGGRRVVAETLAAVGLEYGWPNLPLEVSRTQVPVTKLERLVGRYRYDASPGSEMTFSVKGNTLLARFGERAPFPLISVSESVFVRPGSALEMRFDPPRDEVITGVTIGTAGLYGSHLTRVDPEQR
jgi:CubicO group peptidase (beta-lactamase class C family)